MGLVETSSKPRALVERRDDIGRMIDLLKTGAHLSTAASHVGIGAGTVARWLKEGQGLAVIAERNPDLDPTEHERALIEFAEAVERAQAEAEMTAVGVVWDAAQIDGDVKAAQWILERRFKDRWAQRGEVTGAGGGAIEVEDVGKTRSMVEEALGKLAQQIEASEQALRAEVVEIERGDGREGGWDDDKDEVVAEDGVDVDDGYGEAAAG